MKITFDPNLAQRLMAYAASTQKEFSGFGFVEKKQDELYVYDFVLLDVGSEVFTEIPTDEIIKLMERPDADKMKLWLHRHPMGSGKPGPENWSGTDNATIEKSPLGGVPELVKWSCSAVLTPHGWVGRVDNHITKKTVHVEVSPNFSEEYAQIGAIIDRKFKAMPIAKSASNASDVYWQDEYEFDQDYTTVELIGMELLEKMKMTEDDITALGLDLIDLVDMYCDANEDIKRLRRALRELSGEIAPARQSWLSEISDFFRR